MFLRKTGVAGALALVFGTPLYCSSSYAQSPVSSGYSISNQSLEPIVVTATRFEQSLSDVIPSVTYISREEIDRSGAKSLAELIYAEPGVEYGRNGGLGTVTSFFLRGNESSNALVLLDGQRLRDGITQTSLAEHIPLGMIDSVEIIRGNVSALYGDGAVGGVISIKTRRSEDAQNYYGSISSGSRGTRDIFTGFSTGTRKLNMNVGVQHLYTDGFSATNPVQTGSTDTSDSDRDTYESNAAHIRIQGMHSNVSYGLSVLGSNSLTKFDNSFSGKNPRQRAKLETSSGFVSYKPAEFLTTKFEIGQNDIELIYSYGEVLKTKSNQYRLENLITYLANQSTVLSVERRVDQRSPAGSGGLGERTIDSVVIGHLANLGRTSIQANLRQDDGSPGEQKTTWFGGIGYQLSNRTRVVANTATAFRFPTAYEISTNPELKPEFHRSQEVGLIFSERRSELRVLFFRTETTNPITYEPAPSYAAVNSNYRENSGIELESRYQAGQHRFRFSLTLQDPRSPKGADATDRTQVQSARRAKVFGSFNYVFRYDETDFGAEFFGASKRRDLDGDAVGLYRLRGYGVLNLSLSRRLNQNWGIFGRIDNVFDREYQVAYGYNTPPRGLFFGVRYASN